MQEQKNNVHGGFSFMKVWAVTLYLPLRAGMGRDHLGFSVLFGCVLISIVSHYAKSPGLLWLIPINLVAWFCQLCGEEKRRWRGIRQHTEYGGRSWLLEWIFRDENLAKQIGEPLLSLLIGVLIYHFTSQPNAATYFWYGSVILACWHSMGKQHEERVMDLMHNAMIENQYYAKRMRRRL